MKYMQENSSESQSLNEIDLFDFLKGIWEQRQLIAVVTALFLCAAAAYAWLSEPVYEARAYVLPPTQSDIENFNLGRSESSELKPYSVKNVYSSFVSNLQSESLRRDFFKEVYLPSLGESDRQKSQDTLYRQFLKEITVIQPTKEFPDRFSVYALSNNSEMSVKWLREYIDRASVATEKEIIKNYSKEVEMRARNIAVQIQMLRDNAANKRRDTVLQLREAERVAGAIGLENHQIILGGVTGEIAGSVDPRLIYLRGTKALAAEEKTLQARESDDPFIGDLRKLQGQYDFYKALNVKAEDVAVYRVDGVIQPPDSPIKPKKALILVLGLVLGGSLGVILGLVRQFWMRNRNKIA
ncbi:LPS O-antigen chain length determinant protein WzzB [Pseudomonas fluorescens]|nr:Wzz/FepE/Etk N-terminal domain-containing protein [Pseudomonas fluorescens]